MYHLFYFHGMCIWCYLRNICITISEFSPILKWWLRWSILGWFWDAVWFQLLNVVNRLSLHRLLKSSPFLNTFAENQMTVNISVYLWIICYCPWIFLYILIPGPHSLELLKLFGKYLTRKTEFLQISSVSRRFWLLGIFAFSHKFYDHLVDDYEKPCYSLAGTESNVCYGFDENFRLKHIDFSNPPTWNPH